MFMHTLASLSLAGLLALATQPTQAAEDTPGAIPGGTFAAVNQAQSLFDKGAVFVDARAAAEYAEQHIKGAISVPFKEAFPKIAKTGPGDKIDLSKLPGDKNKVMVFYCNGSPCWKGYKAAEQAINAGYRKVHWFRDGIPAWKSKSLPTE